VSDSTLLHASSLVTVCAIVRASCAHGNNAGLGKAEPSGTTSREVVACKVA
jgi:hypothetical protein